MFHVRILSFIRIQDIVSTLTVEISLIQNYSYFSPNIARPDAVVVAKSRQQERETLGTHMRMKVQENNDFASDEGCRPATAVFN